MDTKRTRYQQGSLTIEKRKTGPPIWVYRWRDTDTNGTRSRRKTFVGTKAEYPTRTSALKQLARLTTGPNRREVEKGLLLPLEKLVEHYRKYELSGDCGKTLRTVAVCEQQLRQYILPKWGLLDISEIKAVAVEAWLKGLPGAPATKAKTRNVMSSLYQHARRYEFISKNPISLVRQGSVRLKEPMVLIPEEVSALLEELDEPFRTMVYLAAVTGMRRGELFGLRWEDVDLMLGQLSIVRSIVDQTVGKTKTRGSKRPLPLPEDAVAALTVWKAASQYSKKQDWVFASPQALGEFPYWPNTVMVRHVMPAAYRAGIRERIGWHTFRHTLATMLLASGAGVKVTQELLRHSSPSMTMGTYAQAVTVDKRQAQDTVAAMFKRRTSTSAAQEPR